MMITSHPPTPSHGPQTRPWTPQRGRPQALALQGAPAPAEEPARLPWGLDWTLDFGRVTLWGMAVPVPDVGCTARSSIPVRPRLQLLERAVVTGAASFRTQGRRPSRSAS